MNGEKPTSNVIDNHVHVGWYLDGYHSPREIWNAAISAGVNEIAVSSTSTCAEKYKLVVREMKELIRISNGRVSPILWITPRMLRTYGIRFMLHSKIEWKGVKMHWLAHPEWGRNKTLLQRGLNIVKQLNVPLLLHSGVQDSCQPHLYSQICKKMKDTTIIIAHGRPVEQTLELLKDYDNVIVDTAFMPIEDVNLLVKKGYAARIAFGTDTPIQLLFDSSKPLAQHIQNTIKEISEVLPYQSSNILDHKIY